MKDASPRPMGRAVLVLAGLFAAVSWTPAVEAKTTFRARMAGLGMYLEGVTAVKKRDYDKGIRYLTPLVDTHPDAKWQDGAHYWLGFAHLAHDNPKRDIDKARTALRRLIKSYPKSGHRWDAENFLKLIEDVLQPQREVKRIKQEMLKE